MQINATLVNFVGAETSFSHHALDTFPECYSANCLCREAVLRWV